MLQNTRVKFVETLNDEQRKAVEVTDGPVQIVAGPGTGKTKTLSSRIAYLLAQGVPPSSIVALTFTKKAAKEMRERVEKLAGVGTEMPTITTFHGLCHRLLRAEKLAIATNLQRQALIANLRKSGVTKLSARDLSLALSNAKNSLEIPAEIAPVVTAYNLALRQENLCDFDDLLQLAYQKLTSGNDVRKYTHVLVDEFQDTNELQYALLRLLGEKDNLFVIGDPLQSIYGFRGASGDIFSTFSRDFPQATRVVLHTNYRSAPEIVALGNCIFAEAPDLIAHRITPGVVQTIEVLNEYSEAQWILDEIEQHVGGTSFLQTHRLQQATSQTGCFSDFAVLYRTHHTAKILRKQMNEHGLPYQVVGEDAPYLQPAIQAVIGVIRHLLEGVIPQMRPFSMAQYLSLAATLPSVNSLPLSKLAIAIIDTFNLTPRTEEHQQHLRQFLSSLVRFEGENGANNFLQHIDDIADQAFYDPTADAVTLLTIHAAKGLEFPYVYVIGCEEGILPLATATSAEEEKRLLYVAATRAKNDLTLLHARRRGGKAQTLSRFIASLPVSHCPRIIDPLLPAQVQKLHRRQQKRAQTSLF